MPIFGTCKAFEWHVHLNFNISSALNALYILCVCCSYNKKNTWQLKGNIVLNGKLTGLHFSRCGMSSGIGKDGDFGLMRENSFGLEVTGAFSDCLPQDIVTAS